MDESGKPTVRHPEEDVIGLGAEGILKFIFGLTTTFDETSIQRNDRYKKLFNKKNSDVLTAAEQTEFSALSQQLAPIRLDPTLSITTENTLTRLVRENVNKSPRNFQNVSVPEDFPQQVDAILDDIFNK